MIISPDQLPIPGLPGKVPTFTTITLQIPNENGEYTFPSPNSVIEEIKNKHYVPGTPHFKVNLEGTDPGQKLDDVQKKLLDTANARIAAVDIEKLANEEIAKKVDIKKLRDFVGDETPMYSTTDSEGIKRSFENSSREIQETIIAIVQRHTQLFIEALVRKIEQLIQWIKDTIGNVIDFLIPKIPYLDDKDLLDLIIDPVGVYDEMKAKLADKASEFAIWVKSLMPTLPEEPELDIPAVDIRTQIRVAVTKYTQIIIDYFAEKMQEIQDKVNAALEALVASLINIELPQLPYPLPTPQQIREYVLGKVTAPPPFDDPIPDPSTDLKLSKQDADAKVQMFMQNMQNKIAEGIMAYYNSLLRAIQDIIDIPMPALKTEVNILSGTVTVTGP